MQLCRFHLSLVLQDAGDIMLQLGVLTVCLSVLAVTLLVAETQAAGTCPEAGKVFSCSPKCTDNYECSKGKVCCTNQCRTKSCVESAQYGASSSDKSKQSGAGIYCNNVKCNSFEVCKQDRATNRMKCQRP